MSATGEVTEARRLYEGMRAERDAVRAERDALRAALLDAIEGMEEMASYVSPYFQEKWGHQEYIARARAAASNARRAMVLE